MKIQPKYIVDAAIVINTSGLNPAEFKKPIYFNSDKQILNSTIIGIQILDSTACHNYSVNGNICTVPTADELGRYLISFGEESQNIPMNVFGYSHGGKEIQPVNFKNIDISKWYVTINDVAGLINNVCLVLKLYII